MLRLVNDLEKEIPEIRHSMLSALGKMNFGDPVMTGVDEKLPAEWTENAALRVI